MYFRKRASYADNYASGPGVHALTRRRSRRRGASAAVAVTLSASAAVAAFASAGHGHQALAIRPAASQSASATLSGPEDPLGVNTATWDSNFPDAAVPGALSRAGLGLIRFPGGSSADLYNWQNSSGVDFAEYSKQVDDITAGQKLVTVNYGTGTPQEAAAWVTQSQVSGQGVTLWEVGNEEYGSWEADNHSDPHTPASYATNALPFMQAIRGADPNAKICYDYGLDGSLANGSGAANWQNWDNTILQADHAYINCADVHWYPVNGLPSESVESIMNTVNNIPTAAGEIHSELSTYDPSADFIVGETNISEASNPWNEEPVGALFSAATVMEWLSYGAHSVDWWDVHNYGSSSGDFGLLSSGTSGEGIMDSPLPPYYGYELASKLAVKGATVGTLNLGQANSFGYYSDLPSGSRAVMLVNANPSSSFTVSPSSVGLTSSTGTEYTYDSANPSIATGSFSGSSISVPPESVVVLTGSGASAGGGSGSSAGSGTFVSGADSTKCIDDNNDSSAIGSKVQMWDCNGSQAQDWTVEADGTIRINGNCLDIYHGGTANGSLVETWTCNGHSNQQWQLVNGTLVNPASGKCLDDPSWSTADGTQLQIWTCNAGANQEWKLS